jgi:hypothetical protein
MVHLAPDDVRTAQTAGVEFARSLAGAPSAWFMLALGEQEDLIRSAIRQAGYPDRTHGSRRTPSMSERGLNGSASPAPCGPRRGVWHERPGATRLPPWRMPGKPRRPGCFSLRRSPRRRNQLRQNTACIACRVVPGGTRRRGRPRRYELCRRSAFHREARRGLSCVISTSKHHPRRGFPHQVVQCPRKVL